METAKERAIESLYNLLNNFDIVCDFLNQWKILTDDEKTQLYSIYTKLDLFIEKIETDNKQNK